MNWEVLQQIVLTLTPVAALIIALSGLSTWKRQLKGSHDFDLSRRLLLSIYKTRDSLKACRTPFVQPGESDKDRDDWEASAYENRWKDVSVSMSELRASILESEVSWGEDFKKEFKELHGLVVRLMLSIRHYIASTGKGPGSRLFSEKDEEVLWGDEEDEYAKELDRVVKVFESKIKPKLGRK